MKVRFILLSICLSLLLSASHAQEFGTTSLPERVQQSRLIVEGKVIRQESFWDQAHRIIFTSHTIDIYKVFKGSLRSGTIEVTTLGGIVGDKGMIVSDAETLNMEQNGIFLLNEQVQAARFPMNHAESFELVGGQDGIISYDMKRVTAQDRSANYGGIESDLYNQIEQLTQEPMRELKPVQKPASNQRVLAATITGFTPTTVHAGAMLDPANNVLTIDGTSFGPASGSAAVLFDDPNDGAGGNYTIVAYNSTYIVSWTPTQIVVRVPGASGTGLIAVRDNTGAVSFSTSNLDVEYSVASIDNPFVNPMGALQPKLADQNGVGGYDFRYSSSTNGGGADFSTAPERAPFERALDTWNKTTGLNFRVVGTTATQAVGGFATNTIELDNTNTGAGVLGTGVLGRTFLSISACSNGTNWEISDIDIVFRRNGVSTGTINLNNTTCPPASNEADFETIMLHELGHAHTLQHIIDGPSAGNPSKVMNYQVFLNSLRRSPDVSAYNGGVYALQISSMTYGTCAGFPSAEMTALPTLVPANDNCSGSFPVTPTPPGLTSMDMRYSTSNRFVDPSTAQLVCSGTSGLYNTVYLPFMTNSTGGDLTAIISGYTTLVDYSPCSGMGSRVTLYQLSSCPGGSSFPAAVDCRTIDLSGNLSPAGAFTGLAANTNYLFVFDGIRNTKASFNVTLGGAALPVRMIDFYGKIRDSHALLTWNTAFEENNRGFEVEHSYDGVAFTRIGFVAAKEGNSTSLTEYQFHDPALAQPQNFYRLKQLDKDGNFEYSKVILLTDADGTGVFRVFENPFRNQLNVQFEKAVHGRISWKLSDMNGRVMASGFAEGNGLSRMRIVLSNDAIPKGVYILELNTADRQYVKKVVKGER